MQTPLAKEWPLRSFLLAADETAECLVRDDLLEPSTFAPQLMLSDDRPARRQSGINVLDSVSHRPAERSRCWPDV